jgi:hypothetical protein
MKQPKHFFNLESNKNSSDEQLIFFNLSYGSKTYNTKRSKVKYEPLKISTRWNIKKEYWNGKPTYRANKNYVSKFGKDLNNALEKIEKIGYTQLSYFRNHFEREPTLSELKELILHKLDRISKKSNDIIITEYITKIINTRTNLEIKSSNRWSKSTGNQYLNLKSQIEKYQESKKITLTFGNLTGAAFMDFFHEINEINKKENGEYYAHHTIAKENKLFRALLNCANEDEITIGFNYNKKEYFINRREIKNEVFLTQDQLSTIIKCDTSHSKEFTHAKNYILLSSFTGLRIGDLVYLHEIKPIKLIHNSKKYDCFITRIRKSQENKDELVTTIPLLAPLKEHLKQNKNEFPKFPAQVNIRKSIKKFLTYLNFNDEIEEKKYYYSIDKVVVKKQRLCDVFTPHDCRSTFISNLKELGVHDEDIEPITHPKHKFTSIVQVYDKTAMIGKAVNLINVLNQKKSSLYRY